VVQAGARGYILKDDADRVLLAAVDAVRQGKAYFSTRVSNVIEGRKSGGDQPYSSRPPRSRLTPREREIVQLLAEGKSNKEVATLLDISVKTAEAHRAHIMLKLNFHSITELVLYAVRNNLTRG
jgi:DNA-binding NarL/FixJ family response regulator